MGQCDQIISVMEAAFDPHWGEAWNARQVADALALPSTHALILDSSGQPSNDRSSTAAFVLSRSAPGEEELLLIAVRPEFRRKGLGERLVSLFIAQAGARGATRVFLEMRENNDAARLYSRLGFEPIGRRKDYYLLSDGSHLAAITLARSLD